MAHGRDRRIQPRVRGVCLDAFDGLQVGRPRRKASAGAAIARGPCAALAGAVSIAQKIWSEPGCKSITPHTSGSRSAAVCARLAGTAQAEASATHSFPRRSDRPTAASPAAAVGKSRNAWPSMNTWLPRHHCGTMPSLSSGLRGSPVLQTCGFPRKIGSQRRRTFPSSRGAAESPNQPVARHQPGRIEPQSEPSSAFQRHGVEGCDRRRPRSNPRVARSSGRSGSATQPPQYS